MVQSGENFFRFLARQLHVERVGAQVDLPRPFRMACFGKQHFLENTRP